MQWPLWLEDLQRTKGRRTAPQSAAGIERSEYRAAWHEAMNVEINGQQPTGTYEAASTAARAETSRREGGLRTRRTIHADSEDKA